MKLKILGGPNLTKLRENVWETKFPFFGIMHTSNKQGKIKHATYQVATYFVPEKELNDYLNKLECDTFINGKDIIYFKYKKWDKSEKAFGKVLVEDNFKPTPKGYLVRYCLIDRYIEY